MNEQSNLETANCRTFGRVYCRGNKPKFSGLPTVAPHLEPPFARGPAPTPPPFPLPRRGRSARAWVPRKRGAPTGSDVSHCLATVAKELVSRNPLEPRNHLGVGDSGFLKRI